MTKKIFLSVLAIVLLCLCCSVSFATDGENTINLGNEIMQSIDKTGDSFNNLVSSNAVNSTVNGVKEGVNNVEGAMRDGMENVEDETQRTTNDIINPNSYNTTFTTTEGTTENSGVSMMSTTTWMWIILSVAAVVIIAAIWYYATQNNG